MKKARLELGMNRINQSYSFDSQQKNNYISNQFMCDVIHEFHTFYSL